MEQLHFIKTLRKISFLFLLFIFSHTLYSQASSLGMNDAVVLSVDSPSTFCAGSQNVYATIANYGGNQIDSVEIYWEVNGTSQPTIHYRQLLDTINGNSPFKKSILLGSVNFNSGSTPIRIYSAFPNGVMDTINLNDTLTTTVQTATPPTDLIAYNGTTTSMDFEVFDISGTVEYEYGLAGFTQGSGTLGSSGTSAFTINSLQSSSSYSIYIRSNCDGTDTSSWVGPFNFCTPYLAPFYNDMESEDLDVPPACWSSKATYSSAWVEVEDYTGINSPYDGTQALYLYSSNSNSSDTLLAFSPKLSDLTASNKRVRFFASSANTNNKLIVGTIEDPNDPASKLNVIDSIVFQQANVYKEVIIDLDAANGYNGVDEYVFLAHNLGSSYTYIRVDNFHYEPIPTCNKPVSSSLSIDSLTPTSVNFSWLEPGAATLWEIEYGYEGFTLGTGMTDTVSSIPATITGLTPDTTYQIYVRSICSRGDTSYTSGPYQFDTPCLITTAPYYNNFETNPVAQEPICWSSFTTKFGPSIQVHSYSGTSAPYRGSRALYINSSSAVLSRDTVLAISPGFADLTAGNKQIRFYANVEQSSSELIIGTMSSPIDVGNINILDTVSFAQPNVYKEIIFEITSANGYNGSDQYIFLSHSLGGYNEDIRIDEFNYETIPSCRKPDSLSVTNITPNSALLSWYEKNTATEWQIQYDTAGFSMGSGTLDTVNSNPYNLTGLNPNKAYEYYVRSICTAGDSSLWTGPFKFETPCIFYSAPYYNNFETEQNYIEPMCWSSISTKSGPWAEVRTYSNPVSNLPYAGSKGLYMYSYNAVYGTDRLMSITPGFSDLTAGNKRIRFYANSGDTDIELIIGTTPDPYSTGNLHPLDTIKFAQDDTYEEVIFEITSANGYNGTDQFIYLEHNLGKSYDYVRIDEFNYETIPSCKRPDSLSVPNITSTSAFLDWNEVNAATQWEVQYGSLGFSLGDGIDSIANNNPFNITGLTPNYYEFYVRSICGSGDTSLWAGPFEFKSGCPASFTAPYSNNFEREKNDLTPLCWDSIATAISATVSIKGYPVLSGSKALNISNVMGSQGTDNVMAVSPRFSDLTANNKRISFFSSTSNSVNKLIIGTMASPTATSLNPIDTVSFTSTNTFKEVLVDFTSLSGYNGTDEYIYLKHSLDGMFSSITIDDFKYFEVPLIDAGITGLVSPKKDINKCFTSTENLDVEIASLGRDTLDFTVDTTVITVNVTGAITQTFTYNIDDNSLNSGSPLAEKDSITVPIGTVDMSVSGVYYFDISLSMNNDGKTSNNILKDTVKANLGGRIIGSDTLCLGDTLTLLTEDYVGGLQWQSRSSGAFTDIIGADSSQIKISPSITTSYRVVACGTGLSDTLTVTPVSVSTPIAKDSSVVVNCGDSAIVALTVTSTNSNALFEWYDVSVGGTALSQGGNIVDISPNGDTLFYKGNSSVSAGTGTTDTFYVQEVIPSSNGVCVSNRDSAVATVDCLVSIEKDRNAFTNITIYPNPSTGIFKLIGVNVDDQLQVSIYNTNGKVVHSIEYKLTNDFSKIVNLSNLAKGIYFVKLQGVQSTEMRKIIIN